MVNPDALITISSFELLILITQNIPEKKKQKGSISKSILGKLSELSIKIKLVSENKYLDAGTQNFGPDYVAGTPWGHYEFVAYETSYVSPFFTVKYVPLSPSTNKGPVQQGFGNQR